MRFPFNEAVVLHRRSAAPRHSRQCEIVMQFARAWTWNSAAGARALSEEECVGPGPLGANPLAWDRRKGKEAAEYPTV